MVEEGASFASSFTDVQQSTSPRGNIKNEDHLKVWLKLSLYGLLLRARVNKDPMGQPSFISESEFDNNLKTSYSVLFVLNSNSFERAGDKRRLTLKPDYVYKK